MARATLITALSRNGTTTPPAPPPAKRSAGSSAPSGTPRTAQEFHRVHLPAFSSFAAGVKWRTRKIRIFPNEVASERLATAILVEMDEQWIATDRACITMSSRNE